jgi:hypothetical protein
MANAPKTKPTDERYTPIDLIECIVLGMGQVGYDPATPKHNPTNARRFTSLPDNGLETDWRALAGDSYVWLNSPFSVGNLKRWALETIKWANRGCEILQLTPVDPTTDWWDILLSGVPVCRAELKKRMRYSVPADQAKLPGGAMQPACVWYFGERPGLFEKTLEERAHFVLPLNAPPVRRAREAA